MHPGPLYDYNYVSANLLQRYGCGKKKKFACICYRLLANACPLGFDEIKKVALRAQACLERDQPIRYGTTIAAAMEPMFISAMFAPDRSAVVLTGIGAGVGFAVTAAEEVVAAGVDAGDVGFDTGVRAAGDGFEFVGLGSIPNCCNFPNMLPYQDYFRQQTGQDVTPLAQLAV
jgi:hypothetical protein